MPDFFLCSCHVVDVSAGHSFHSDSVYFPISQLPAADGDNSLASISFHFFMELYNIPIINSVEYCQNIMGVCCSYSLKFAFSIKLNKFLMQ